MVSQSSLLVFKPLLKSILAVFLQLCQPEAVVCAGARHSGGDGFLVPGWSCVEGAAEVGAGQVGGGFTLLLQAVSWEQRYGVAFDEQTVQMCCLSGLGFQSFKETIFLCLQITDSMSCLGTVPWWGGHHTLFRGCRNLH